MNFINENTVTLTPGAVIRYLESLDIESISSFLGTPDTSEFESCWNLDNMQETIEALHTGFSEGKTFWVQVDSDADGITSSAIFINYFKSLYPQAKILWRMHEGKQHGISINDVPIEADYIIIPDAGSNQCDEHRHFTSQGRKVIVMDHHIVTDVEPMEGLIIVNNQTSARFMNKDLSGAGVVFKVIEAYNKTYHPYDITYTNYMDLAAIGIVADMMDTRNLDNNAIVYYGTQEVKSPIIKAIIARNEYRIGKESINKTDIGWNIGPFINAVIRSGSMEEKELFFRSFIDTNCEEIFDSEFRGKLRQETLFEYSARMAVNLKNRQNTSKEKSMLELVSQIEKDKLNENSIIVIPTSGATIHPNIIGLVAMGIANKYNKPTLIVRPVVENGKTYLRGSARSSSYETMESFSEALMETGLMDYCAGHDNAFGVSFLQENLSPLIEKMNERLKNETFSIIPKVVASVGDMNWSSNVLQEFAECEHLYGNGIPKPVFHYEFYLDAGDFKIQGKDRNSVKLYHRGVNFIAFKCLDLIDKLDKVSFSCYNNGNKIKVQVLGSPTINEFMGKKNVQVMLDKIEIEESCHMEGRGF